MFAVVVQAQDVIIQRPNNYQTFTVNGVSFKMIRVRGNGSTYYIGETEVTHALWEAVMGNNPSLFNGDDLPIEQVGWNDCQIFISKLNMITGKNFRLPTEAEWEFAAKGGLKSHGYKYSGSNTLEEVAWYNKNAYYCGSNGENVNHPDYGPHKVKAKRPNELGIYDMSGNVWEWCEDAYNSSGSLRVCRGGCWSRDAKFCLVDDSDWNGVKFRCNYIGFRLALDK